MRPQKWVKVPKKRDKCAFRILLYECGFRFGKQRAIFGKWEGVSSMSNAKIKICRVNSLETAAVCAECGVDFLGMHQIHAPLEADMLELCKSIRSTFPSLSLVLLTQEECLEKLLEMCLSFEWDCIQMHQKTKFSPQEILKFKRLLMVHGRSPKLIEVLADEDLEKASIKAYAAVVDYILFDFSRIGGQGKEISSEGLRRIAEFATDVPYFLAGGLRAENVADKLNILHPFAVDVQSGVEREKQKDPELIRAFCQAVRRA